MSGEWMTAEQVADHLGVSRERATKIMSEEKISAVRVYPTARVLAVTRTGQGTRMDLLTQQLRPLAQTIVDDAPLPHQVRVDRHDIDDGITVIVSWHRLETFPSPQMHAEVRERVDSVRAIASTRLLADPDTSPEDVSSSGERRWVYGADLRDEITCLDALARVVAAARRDHADDQAAARAAEQARKGALAELAAAADRVDNALATPDRNDLLAAYDHRRHLVRVHRDAEVMWTHRLSVEEIADAARLPVDDVHAA